MATEHSTLPEAIQHSTLELDLSQDGRAAPIVGQQVSSEKITGYDAGKQATTIGIDYLPPERTFPSYYEKPHPPLPSERRKLLGFKRKTFFVSCSVVVVLVAIAVILGGVLGSHRHKTIAFHDAPPLSTQNTYTNTGLAAMQWTDANGTLHKRLYYQDHNNSIRESAWDNSTAFDSAWQVHPISDGTKPGTPIAAVAGYPHTSHNHTLVKNVYYMAPNDQLLECQAPSNASQAWENDNFSDLYTASNGSFLAAYWNQNIKNASEELVVLFQDEGFANGITQGRYTSNRTTSNPWVANNFGFSQPKGSTFAMALASYRSGRHLMLYTVDDSSALQQHEYTISDTNLVATDAVALTSSSATGLTVDPHAPFTVVPQDNQPFYEIDSRPQCMFDTPLANLIIFAVPDRSSLVLNAWNCTTGFLDQTSDIQHLQKANTTFLSLASMSDRVTGDGSLYIMFDSGTGPQVEEWTVPKLAGDPWVTRRNVTVDFGL